MFRTLLMLCLIFPDIVPSKKPHIILIIGDDLGWNDVGFHGSNQIPTPNIDALAYNGVILNRFYAQATCTPSRAALLTGQYPIRIGYQGAPLKAGENRYIPLDIPTLPEHLKTLGYSTNLIGKWHLGYACKKYGPTKRGFDKYFGYWNGYTGYFNYTRAEGYDLHDDLQPARSSNNTYATDIFTDQAIDVIKNHDNKNPLFLMVSHMAAHTGYNGVELEVPNSKLANDKFGYIKDEKRRLYADLVHQLDQSIGKIVTALSDANILDNSIVMFLSDNGGPTVGSMENRASNWPFKGLKASLYEGGVRVLAALYSPLLAKKGYVNNELIHISDLFATFYKIGGGDLTNLADGDSIDQWDTISENLASDRKEILLDFDEVNDIKAIIGHSGRFKLINGSYDQHLSAHLGESGRDEDIPDYKISAILHSDVNKAILSVSCDNPLTINKIKNLRSLATNLNCTADQKDEITCSDGCLFDLNEDSCEHSNVILDYPDVVMALKEKLEIFEKATIPQGDRVIDPRSDPRNFDGHWSNWLENVECS